MTKLGHWAMTLLIVAFLIALATLFLWAIKRSVDEANPEIVVALLVVAGGFASSQWLQRRVERERIKEARRQKLAPLAEELFAFFRQAGHKVKHGEELEFSREDEEGFSSIQDGLLLWGSAAIVAEWANFMRLMESKPDDPLVAINGYTRILHAMRQELGQQDAGLAKRDLLRLFLTDADQHFDASDRF